MLACGCLDPIGILAHLAGRTLLSLATLVLALICLIGLLLGAIVVLGHLTRREQDDDTERDEDHVTLASFHWETPSDPDDPH
ncbi:hypothetical protein ACFY0A_13010 [Streptomyces sp. NPDC001698]|uniref:hypothetical protein n=1 Tax=unclassified Streptomyces TaxID=2593676 RepID=UPI003690E574